MGDVPIAECETLRFLRLLSFLQAQVSTWTFCLGYRHSMHLSVQIVQRVGALSRIPSCFRKMSDGAIDNKQKPHRNDERMVSVGTSYLCDGIGGVCVRLWLFYRFCSFFFPHHPTMDIAHNSLCDCISL